ncbi:MAG TPA: ABC transporter permease [Gemmatimonadaceae bacterium]|jgi:putative ABC transport system permease protein
MKRLCLWLLERTLPPEWSDHVIGDLLEQSDRGVLWTLRQTISTMLLPRLRRPRGDAMLSTFFRDMRLGARHLRRAPAFAITSIVTLAIAIGATAAIFSVIEPVLLRPLPYPSSDRIMFVWERGRDGSRDNVGYRTILDVGNQSRSIESWAAIGSWEPTLGDDRPERVVGDRVSWSYFHVLGVKPMLGRNFLAEEDRPDLNLEVILSYGLWQRRYAGDSTIIGKRIAIGSARMAVVGVMPASFDNVASPGVEIWRVLGYAPNLGYACRTCHHLRMIARIKSNVAIDAARTEVDGMFVRLIKQFPMEYAGVGAMVVSMQSELTSSYRPALLALTGAVLLVLLIAIANVTNLQLARAVRRNTEFAVRTALGAERGRLTRQLLAEGLVLALLGGVAGIAVAAGALPALVNQLPSALPRLAAIHLDVGVLAAVALLILLITLAMAIIPGRRSERGLGEDLRAGRRLASSAQHRTRSSLVVAEVALAAMLLGSASLVARSVVRLLSVNAGFDTTHLLSLQVSAVGPRYTSDASIYAYHDALRQAVGAIPGVMSVALSNQLPLAGNVDRYGVLDTDNPPPNPELAPSADRYTVTPDYLRTMHIPLIAGRWFTDIEAADTSNRVALVSASLAAKLWPGQSALGHHVRMGGDARPIRTVIGVTGDVKHTGLDAVVNQQFYVPDRQWFEADNGVIVVRSSTDAASIAAAVRRAVSSVDPSLPVIRVATMDQLIAATTSQRRLALVLFGAFALAAVLLAAAGIYGVLAGNVAERTREIGLRAALGATPREVMTLIVSQGARLGVLGLAIGLAMGAGLARYLQTFLFEIGPGDPIALSIVVATLGAVVISACTIPALRAVRVDPVEALRND